MNPCEHKTRYASKHEAKSALDRMRKTRREHARMVIYKCQFCQGWHYGHNHDLMDK